MSIPPSAQASPDVATRSPRRRRRPAALVAAWVVLLAMLTATPASAAPGVWKDEPDAPSARNEGTYVRIGTKFYLAGGKKSALHIYDSVKDSWSTGAPMPAKIDHVQGVAVNGKLYMIGGLESWPAAHVNTVWIYDPKTNSWSKGATMGARGRGAGGVAVRGGKIYYAGGLHAGQAVRWFDVYDPATDRWKKLPNMPRTREHFHAQTAGGRFWAIGGRNLNINNFVTPTDAFRFKTGKWETGYAPMPTPRGGYASSVIKGEVVILGGEGGGIARPEVEAYAVRSNTWRTLADMPVPRHGYQGAKCSGGIYLATGRPGQGGGKAVAHHDAFFPGGTVKPCEPKQKTAKTAAADDATSASDGGTGSETVTDEKQLAAAAISFGRSVLDGLPGAAPTTLEWGPDGRLYVGYFDGTIRAYTIARDGKNDYRVTKIETITKVKNLPNHNDDGSPNGSVSDRLLLGIAVGGTASNPVIYASSSDPRIGGGKKGATNVDTNSGVISRLTWNGSAWLHVPLVQGLPRSEENHGTNGLFLKGNTLYVAQGGNTNKGGPSANFVNLPEFAFSAAILKVDLAAIGNQAYELPTLDDPGRAGTNDANDPFGGNDGKNMAKITSGSPVTVHAPGFRNPYDLVIATVGNHAGKMYVPDNGPNKGWGDVPQGEGTNNCTNANVGQSEGGTSDALHLVTPGYYGGHPNPTRGNKSNTFAGGQSPIGAANPVECDFRDSKSNASTNISLLPNSSNGIAEYKANNFGGAMKGDLIIAAYQPRKVVRISLNAAGTAVTLRNDDFATFSTPSRPLDVATGGPFAGTIWIADLQGGGNHIVVLEPGDFGGGGGGGGCSGANDPSLDEDGDGYSNRDEIRNGTDPCSAASFPPDADGDGKSDLLDNDDDNDGIPDRRDRFAVDRRNGRGTTLPFDLSWENDAGNFGGLEGMGFTGLMTNGKTDYRKLWNPNAMTISGAAGVITVGSVPDGDAWKRRNSQRFGLQLGFVPPKKRFTVRTQIVGPFDGISPENQASMGLFVGNGDQSNYLKLVLHARGGAGGVQVVKEQGDRVRTRRMRPLGLPGPSTVDLVLLCLPKMSKVRAGYVVPGGSLTWVGKPISVPRGWLDRKGATATGIISTSRGPADPFPATWEYLRATRG